MSFRQICRRVFISCIAVLLSAGLASSAPRESGIVIQEVPWATSQERNLQPGDILFSWHREPTLPSGSVPSAGKLSLPFDLTEVFLEQVPRGPVIVEGRRASTAMSWVLPGAPSSDLHWIRTAPVLTGEMLDLYHQARYQSEVEIDSGLQFFRSAAKAAVEQEDAKLAVWLLSEGARNATVRNRWDEADSLYRESVSLAYEIGGDAYISAQILRSWGFVLQGKAVWSRAEDCFTRALALDRQKSFESLSSASSLILLGYNDNLSAGPKDDNIFFRQAIEIRHRLAPGSVTDALGWFHWGQAAILDKKWLVAAERFEHAAKLLKHAQAAGIPLAEVLSSLAEVRIEQGETSAAEALWRRAYALLQEQAPKDLLMSRVTQGLGLGEARKGNLERAEKLLATSLEVSRTQDPEGFYAADAFRRLGQVQAQEGKHHISSENLCQAVGIIESWRRKFQANEERRSRWGNFFGSYYRDCAESLFEIGRQEDAFLILEKGRARAFLDLEAERDLRQAVLSTDLRRTWKDLDVEYDRAQEALENVRSQRDGRLEDILNLEGRLRDIHRKKEGLLEQIRPSRSIRYSEPSSLGQTRRQLEPGTVLLYYSVGQSKTLIYVVSSDPSESPGWTVIPLELGAAQLKRRTESFRKTLVAERANQRDLQAQARALYDILVRPAEPYLSKADRIVISPDGPLHTLPFSALQRDQNYLIEWKPLHFILSATVYGHILERRKTERPPWKLVAFGDPAYPRSALGKAKPPEVLLRMGLRSEVTPLPATRKEVEGIASLFEDSRVFLEDKVTETTVKESIRDSSLVHFAVHGLLDERVPLNSGLILTPSRKPGVDRDNGILQAWEIMEDIPLDADLVTLSACDTALGREIGGEGLIGLTRAFQYAGARSVIGTLWGISDRSTAGFMVQLYKALRAGKTKDEALREAQIAQIHSSKPQPFYWAAFQLFGDWR